jgi:hypothetical protein
MCLTDEQVEILVRMREQTNVALDPRPVPAKATSAPSFEGVVKVAGRFFAPLRTTFRRLAGYAALPVAREA